MLTDYAWRLKYTPEDGDLVKLFYIPALEDAERYDRLTGYFNAGALALAARGIEGLVRNGGRMRLVVGCTLDPPEIEAIERGEALREQIEKHLATLPLAPPDVGAADALEMLAWMVARGHLDVKVAVPCDSRGKPVHDSAIFHEKTGIVEDRAGDRIAWTGSLNETAAGWQRNSSAARWSTTTCRGTRCGSSSVSGASTASARRIRRCVSSTCTTRERSRPTCTGHSGNASGCSRR